MAADISFDEYCQVVKDIMKGAYDRLLRGGVRLSKIEVLFGDEIELLFFPVND